MIIAQIGQTKKPRMTYEFNDRLDYNITENRVKFGQPTIPTPQLRIINI